MSYTPIPKTPCPAPGQGTTPAQNIAYAKERLTEWNACQTCLTAWAAGDASAKAEIASWLNVWGTNFPHPDQNAQKFKNDFKSNQPISSLQADAKNVISDLNALIPKAA